MPRVVPTGFYLLLLGVLLFGNSSLYQTIFAPNVLEVTVLDVGDKSDAILLRSPNGKLFLIDTGKDASVLRALGSHLSVWQRKIDGLVLTNTVTASVGGVPEVMDRYHITTVIRSAAQGMRGIEDAFASATKEALVLRVKRGDRISFGNNVYADVLWPPEQAAAMNAADGPLVLRISYGNTSFLIQNNLPSRISKWLAIADSEASIPNLIISSTTPKGAYFSDGKSVVKK